MKNSVFLLSLLLFLLVACEGEDTDKGSNPAEAKPTIVTTTGMIEDAVSAIVGDSFEVISLMGAGVDPHLYKAKKGDLTLLREASVIVYNGLHLEGKMGEVLEKLGRKKPVVAIGEGIPETSLIYHGDNTDSKDPHIWFDLMLWSEGLTFLENELGKVYPSMTSYFKTNLKAYQDKLLDIHEDAINTIQKIPMQQRVLITAHDAFSYFGKAYQIEVKGLQGISTVAEFGLKDVKELVDFIVERKIKAVFVESSIPRKSLEAVVEGCQQKGHDIKIGGTLYSDAMGEKGSEEGTFIGMFKHNVKTIVESLE